MVAVTGSGALLVSGASALGTGSVPDSLTWDEDDDIWGLADSVFSIKVPIQIIGSEFYQAEAGGAFAGGAVSVVLCRTGLTIYGRDQHGRPKVDPGIIKNVQGIWPEVSGVPGTTLQVSVGTHETPEGPISWLPDRNFVIGTDTFLDFIVSGRYLAVCFESEGQEPWTLTGYDLELDVLGGR